MLIQIFSFKLKYNSEKSLKRTIYSRYVRVFKMSMSYSILLGLLGICLFRSVESKADPYINGEVKTGEVTYYGAWNKAYGSCGFPFPTKNPYTVCALSSKYMKAPKGVTNPNMHPLCDKKYCIHITGPKSSVIVKISDTVQGNADNIDLPDVVFDKLADRKTGSVLMKWKFVECKTLGPTPVKVA